MPNEWLRKQNALPKQKVKWSFSPVTLPMNGLTGKNSAELTVMKSVSDGAIVDMPSLDKAREQLQAASNRIIDMIKNAKDPATIYTECQQRI